MTYRDNGAPSPLAAGTADDDGLVPPFAFDAVAAGQPELSTLEQAFQGVDTIDLGAAAPAWLGALARLIRPLSVGALMAIPTVGAATVGAVAAFDPARGMAMAAASTAFLAGLPLDIVLLIGTLATGYGFARSFEKVRSGH